MSEKEVEQLCTGKLQATPEQHDVISKALGLPSDASDTVCLGRPLHGNPRERAHVRSDKIPHHHHDNIDATHLVRHARARHAEALKAGRTIVAHQGLNPPGVFTWLRLKTVFPYNDDTARFDFAFEDPEVISNPLVSSTCVVSAPEEKPLYEEPGTRPICPPDDGDEDGPIPVYRAYTPVTKRDSVGILSLVIKKQPAPPDTPYPPGKMSNYIHALQIGERLGIMGYLQRPPSMIPWEINQYDAVTMIAGGVGITPLIQIIDYSLHDPSNSTKFLILNGNSTENDIIMRDELESFQQKYPANFEVVNVLSRPPEGWTGESGRIDADLIKKYAPPPPAGLGLNALVCVSGPPAMLESIAGPREGDRYNGYTGQGELRGALKEIGYTAEQVHKF
ncbi:hypothetical protein GYMLUDRAFT_246547 [Collybiopsis luxurians FD-317 M1]|uniref:cytochrome-b5 reductase n=1 Tax=Collybiopsis luxurians FD-317 M1 TaxID=944289 RepID=A0A0D0B3Q5_9AGAR|nr:hypothetical protein GYMLUDRAFT_246547 [Collybiopsis luxurians FD-317 M1]